MQTNRRFRLNDWEAAVAVSESAPIVFDAWEVTRTLLHGGSVIRL